jgi:hypothetical protein
VACAPVPPELPMAGSIGLFWWKPATRGEGQQRVAPSHGTHLPAVRLTHPRLLCAHVQLVGQYASRGRTGVAAPSRDVEAYLLPTCPLSDRLLAAARGAAGPRLAELLPGGEVGPSQLLLALIHRKVSRRLAHRRPEGQLRRAAARFVDHSRPLPQCSCTQLPPPQFPSLQDWRPSPGFVRPVKRQRVHPAAGAAEPLEASAAGERSASLLPPPPELPLQQPSDQQQQQQPTHAAPAAPQAVALPAGLDLDAISALAAALGVAPAAPHQPQAPAAPASPLDGPPDGDAVPHPPPAAPAMQADQLQQLLASLPPLAAAAGVAGAHPAAGQHADAGARRSRWEGSQVPAGHQPQQVPPPPPQLEQQASGKRRSRWEGGEGPGERPPQGAQPGSSTAQDPGPAASAAPPPPGPMGPMQRIPMQRAAQLQQPGVSSAPPAVPGPGQPPFGAPPGAQALQPPHQPPFSGGEAAPPPYGMLPQAQHAGAPPFHAQAGLALPGRTGGYSAGSGGSHMMGPPQQPPMAHGGGGPPPAGYGPPGSGPMYPAGQQYGGRAPRPHFDGGRGGRFGGRGRGWSGRDAGRGRVGRGGRGPY